MGLDPSIAQQYPLSILVVEDERINQMLAKKILGKLGFKTDIAENGKEGVLLMKKTRYDIVFMDLMMPVMDGFAMTRWIRGTLAQDHQPVVIAMTANISPQDKIQCFESGMDDFLSKPVFPENFQALIKKWGEQIYN